MGNGLALISHMGNGLEPISHIPFQPDRWSGGISIPSSSATVWIPSCTVFHVRFGLADRAISLIEFFLQRRFASQMK